MKKVRDVEYKITKEECERNIKGVCEGCGGLLSAMETVDNAGSPTFWQGCEHCSCFRSGVDQKHFRIARKLIEEYRMVPYSHMNRYEYEQEGRLEYYLESQTAGLSRQIAYIAMLLQEE